MEELQGRCAANWSVQSTTDVSSYAIDRYSANKQYICSWRLLSGGPFRLLGKGCIDAVMCRYG